MFLTSSEHVRDPGKSAARERRYLMRVVAVNPRAESRKEAKVDRQRVDTRGLPV
jgi:hypothetical protein